MPDINEDMMRIGGLTADYNQIATLTDKVLHVLEKSKTVKITTPSGTDLTMRIEKRTPMPDTGLYHKSGEWGNLPAGEVCLAPVEGTTNGTLVIDSMGIIVTHPLKVTIKNGWASKFDGPDVALFFVGLDAPVATASNPLLGNLLAVLSGFTCGLMMLGLRWLARVEHAGSASAVFQGNLLAFLVCLGPMLPLGEVRATDLLVVGYLGVFQIGLAYAFLTRALVHVPALEAALLLFVEPVLSPFWAFLVHGEMPGGWSLLGCLVILGATVVRTVKEAY